MAAHGKLRRERGLQPEYDAQVKVESITAFESLTQTSSSWCPEAA
uniref:Rho GTPase activating protein 4 n=1 Tax=Mus musculus TaxID=10090 RepID=D6RFT8_MOUSE